MSLSNHVFTPIDWERLKLVLAEEDKIHSEQKELLNRQCQLEKERALLSDPIEKRLQHIASHISQNAKKYYPCTFDVDCRAPTHISDMRKSSCLVILGILSSKSAWLPGDNLIAVKRPSCYFNLSIPNTWIELEEVDLILEIEASVEGIHKHFYDVLKKMNSSLRR